MKSLFLGLTFLLATFSGTTDVKETQLAEEFVCSNWATINPQCDNTYWLCTDMYEDLGEFIDAVNYFNKSKC